MTAETTRSFAAGAARSLWMNYCGLAVQPILMHESGAHISHLEFLMKMSGIAGAAGMSLTAYAGFVVRRAITADNAEYLVMNRGATSGWLWGVSPGQIEDCAHSGRDADKNLSFRETVGGRTLDPMTGQRVYTLEEVRDAHRLGFLAGTDRSEGAARVHFLTNEYTEERDRDLEFL